MTKTKCVVAFFVVIVIVIMTSMYVFNNNYNDKLTEYENAMFDMTTAIQHQYDTVFYSINQNIENTVNRINHKGLSDRLLSHSEDKSLYIDRYVVYTKDEKIYGRGQNVDFSKLEVYFTYEYSAYDIAIIESSDDVNQFYVVNRILNDEQDYLLLASINYKEINEIIDPVSFRMFDSYPYLISHDGYYLYHPNENICGRNIFDDKELIIEETKMTEKDYQHLINAFKSPGTFFYYNAFEVSKIGYSKALEDFEGTIFISADYTAMKKRQLEGIISIVAPAVISFLVSAYLFWKYIYVMKYTDYYTEIKNEIAFDKYFLSRRKKQDILLLLKIEDIVSSKDDYSMNNDRVLIMASKYFKNLEWYYHDVYRLSRIHYVFVLKHDEEDRRKLLNCLNANIAGPSHSEIHLRGKVLFTNIFSNETYFEMSSKLMDLSERFYQELKSAAYHKVQDFYEIIDLYQKNVMKKMYVEKMIMNEMFQPYFQPIVDMSTGKTVKYEVLMRPTCKSEMNTGEIIQVAEEEGWIESIDKTIIKRSFELYQDVKKKYDKGLDLSINLSGVSIGKPILEYILSLADMYEVNMNHITIEITETAAFSNLDECVRILNQLREKGFKLAIDDFGTGFAHVELLSKLEVDYVKIDGIFIKDVHKDDRKFKTLNALIYLASNYDTEVIAEYVENEEILEALSQLDIEYGQGYHFSKPFNRHTLLTKI